MELTPTIKQLAIAATIFSAGFLSYEAILRATNGNSLFTISDQNGFEISIIRVIEKSRLPMYLIAKDLTISKMNRAALDFLSLEPKSIEGKSMETLIDHISLIVPDKWRNCFLAEQQEMMKLVRTGRLPEAEVLIPVDLNSSVNPDNRGKYILWVRAERLFLKEGKEPIGSLALVRIREIDDWKDSEIDALTRRCNQRYST